MTNGLIVAENATTQMSMVSEYGTIIAQSGLFGCDNVAQGKALMLMAQSEGRTITEMKEKYHLAKIGGKVTLLIKANWMLAEFRRLGGDFKWITELSDREKAILHLEYRGNLADSKYTIEDAELAGLLRPDAEWDKRGNWEKRPANMLRARAITDGVNAICPEVQAGFQTYEDALINDPDADAIEAEVITPPEFVPKSRVVEAATAVPLMDTSATDLGVTQVDGPIYDDSSAQRACSEDQVVRIKALVADVRTRQPNIADKLKNKLVIHKIAKLADLTQGEADRLIAALEAMDLSEFVTTNLVGWEYYDSIPF